MSTCTAELILGQADQNHSGIQFNHRLSLYENSRSVLVMERKPSLDDTGELMDRWIPHPDAMLEDAMVMLAGYGARDPEVLRLIAEMKKVSVAGEIFDLGAVDEGLMEKLYAASRKAFKLTVHRTRHSISSERWKVMACIFKFSNLLESVGRLDSYDIDVEICQSVYQSEYSPWNDSIGVWGEIK